MAQAKIPKPYRRKNHRGKEQGSYYCKVRGEEINLATKDPDEAWRRAAAAKRDNKRNFKEDADAAADAAIEARTKPIPPPTAPVDELAAARAAAAAATAETATAPPIAKPDPPSAPAGNPAGTAPQTDHAPRPAPAATPAPSPSATSEAPAHERVEEAAREATQDRDTSTPPPPQPPPGMQFDPAFINMMAKQGAKSIVELQLMLQAWIVFKRTGDKPGQVPADAVAGPLAIWEHQLQVWIARWQLDMIPPWAVALFLTSMCYPLQHAGRTKKPPAGNLGSVQDAEFTETPPFRKAA